MSTSNSQRTTAKIFKADELAIRTSLGTDDLANTEGVSQFMILAKTTKKPIKIMSKDKKSVSRAMHIRHKNDGRSPTNHQPSGKPTQNNPTNMVSNIRMREMQKKRETEKAAEAAVAEGKQDVETNNADISDVNANSNTENQEGAVGSKRKLNQPQPTVNAQAGTVLTSATHMGVDGPSIPAMGLDANM
jgi:hypothetical protein